MTDNEKYVKMIAERDRKIVEQQHIIESHQQTIGDLLAEKMYREKKYANLEQDSKKNLKHLSTLEKAYNDLNE